MKILPIWTECLGIIKNNIALPNSSCRRIIDCIKVPFSREDMEEKTCTAGFPFQGMKMYNGHLLLLGINKATSVTALFIFLP